MSASDPGVRGGADELASGGEPGGRHVPPWVWRVAGLVALGVAVALAGPGLLSGQNGGRGRVPSPTPTANAVVPPVLAAPVPRLGWAPRGSLMGSDFAAAAAGRFRQDRTDVDRLLWAGSLDTKDRVAVVAYLPSPDTYSDGIEVAALRVGPDDDPARAAVVGFGAVHGPDGAVGIAWRGSDSRARLLVIGAPATLDLQVSPVVDYHRDGSISRRWRHVRARDGVVVVDLGPRVDPAIVVRPTDASSDARPFVVDVPGPTTTAEDIEIPGSHDDRYAGPPADRLVDGVALALRPLFDLHDVAARVIWDGQIASGRGSRLPALSGRGALVWVRRHDGPVFQVFVYVNGAGALQSYAANPVPWAVGDRLPYTFSTFEDSAPLYVLNPSGPGSVTVTPALGKARQVGLDGNGVGTLMPDANTGATYAGARVVVHDRTGRPVLTSRLVDPGTVDAFGLYL